MKDRYRTDNPLVLSSEITQKLIAVRGQYTLPDRDVAALYGVETRVINQVVKDNPDKFPAGQSSSSSPS